jgi:dynein heavy chain 1
VVEGEWNSFKQILGKRSSTMEDQIPLLQARIMQEETQVQAKIKEIEHEWKENRPKDASSRPEMATPQIKKSLNQLTLLGTLIKQTVEELGRVCKAKELLNMELTDAHYLDSLEEDYMNLMQVWQSIGEIWQTIEKIDQTPF